MTGLELGWIAQFKKVFSPLVLLLLVFDGMIFEGNNIASSYSKELGEAYSYTVVVYSWLGIVGLQSLAFGGIALWQQYKTVKHEKPKGNGRGSKPKANAKKIDAKG